jgi:hypothetical protein
VILLEALWVQGSLVLGKSSAWRQLAVLSVLLLPAAAEAAPYGESPPRPRPDGARCLTPTGAPGELSLWARGGVELLAADGAGAIVPLGRVHGCPRAAADPGGAGVVAGMTAAGLRVALREPAGPGFAAPLTLAPTLDVFQLDVAVSPRGDAVVAWSELDRDLDRVRVRVARRDAGGAFGAVEDLVPWRDAVYVEPQVGMAADGEALVALAQGGRSWALTVSAGRPGAPLGPPQRLDSTGANAWALAVAPNGTAVLAEGRAGATMVSERPPGGAFAAPRAVGETSGPDAVAAAFGTHGRVVVAWQENSGEAVAAAVRDPVAGFGPRIEIVPAPMTGPGFGINFRELGPEPLPLFSAAVAPDGRARVAWTDDGRIEIATLSGTALLERRRAGGTLRDPEGISLTTLADGRAALAWTNDRGYHEGGPGRVHVAVEGAPPRAEPPPPRVTLGAVRPLALRPSQSLVVPVRCSAACDLAVGVPGQFAVNRSLARAGRTEIEIGTAGRALAPAGGGDVRIVARVSAPGARRVARVTKTVRLTRRPPLPLPRLVGVRARRLEGGKVEVRWRTTGPARETVFTVLGKRERRGEADVELDVVLGTRRRSYAMVLEYASRARWISVQIAPYVGREQHTVVVRVP